MSASSSERRLSANNRNAYVIINADECETTNAEQKVDDSRYLTVKPASRVRHFSDPTSNKNNNCNNSNTVCNFISPVPTTTPKISQPDTNATKVPTQVGIDRYITILKRKRSPTSEKMASVPKIIKNSEKVFSQNRFALLANEKSEPVEASKSFKPPPVYLREQNTTEVVKGLIPLIGENSFYVTRIKRGQLFEIKIQVNHENNYRKLISNLEAKKKNFYTYQLKSAKGLQVVIKGIDSCVQPEEVKEGLKDKGFKVKSVVNIRNREKIPQPLFRVELEPGDMILKKNEIHPIYELRYLLHRRVTVEEPHKRVGPIQCLNCQEYGHSKTYCKLPTVCVVCGELHKTAECNKPKNDSMARKCSNCGNNHTANYRGCPVYMHVKGSVIRKPENKRAQLTSVSTENPPLLSLPVSNQFSYADMLKAGQAKPTKITLESKQAPITNLQPQTGIPEHNFSRLENMMENLVQTTNNFTTTMSHLLNNFTNSMSSMMTEMMKMQQMLLQTLTKKP